MLRILRQKYAPNDREADLGALQKYSTARSQPIRQGKISAWLNDFDNAYVAIRRRDPLESNDRHVKRDFLAAISSVSYFFADRQVQRMADPMYEKEGFPALLERYRRYLANIEGFKATTSSMASATFYGQSHNPLNSPGSNNNRCRSPCICGKNHAYSNCWYIMSLKRPRRWKPNKGIEAKVSEAIAKDDKLGRKLRAMMELDVQRRKDKESNKPAGQGPGAIAPVEPSRP